MAHRLKLVETDEEWNAWHSIREHVLWEARGKFGGYDRGHPSLSSPSHFPLLLMSDGVPVGAISVEIDSREAWFRRVAIREEVQRRGHGRRMIELAVAFAREKGCVHVRSNVDSAAVSFYRKLGFTETNVPLAHSVSMHRAL